MSTRNTVFGLIFIAICGFAIIQSRVATGERGERSRTEVSQMVSDKEDARMPTSNTDCYKIEGKEYCGEKAEKKLKKMTNPPAKETMHREVGPDGTHQERY